MPEKPLIIWQKWEDPLIPMDLTDLIEEEDEEEEDDDQPDLDKLVQKVQTLKQQFIVTPMGVLPYNENTACSKIFNFWVGHTNFTINKEIMQILESCDGVEALDIFTRYRFRIAVGKAFKDSTVMRQINNRTYDYIYEHTQQ